MNYPSGPRPEQGFCAVHRKRRSRDDLVPRPEFPGTFVCDPRKPCYATVEMVVCRKHNRRRKATQMTRVGNEWECSRGFECRAPNRAAPRLGGRPQETFSPPSRENLVWGPSAVKGGVPAHVRPGVRRDRNGIPLGNRQVFCMRHGKQLPVGKTVTDEKGCAICVDSSTCLSTPLEVPSGQPEQLLCRQHDTIRSAAFLQLCEDRQGFQCLTAHGCRCVHLASEEAAAPVSEARRESTAEENALPNEGDATGMLWGESAPHANAGGSSNSFLPAMGEGMGYAPPGGMSAASRNAALFV